MELAINGGIPIRRSHLAYGKQTIDEEDINKVIEVLKGNYLTTGPAIREFEGRVAEYVGVNYALAVSNGTAALHVALFGCDIKPGDEVIVTPMTFAASANAIFYMGAIPVFADIDEKTLNINVADVRNKITHQTKAIIAVDFAGQPVDLDELRILADEYGLRLIEDGAHSLGSTYKGRKIGGQADVTTFSFHPVKPVTTGEGGMITTNDPNIYERMLMFRTHGITREKEQFYDQTQGGWYYEQQYLGYNYRLTDIQAALGTSQMSKIDLFIKRRREIVQYYNKAFSSFSQIITPYEQEDRVSGYHIYVIRLDLKAISGTRKEIFEALQAEGIGVNIHYIPVYYHPYYKEKGYKRGICPVAEQIYEEILTLPLFPSMTDKDVEDVIRAVKKVLYYYRKGEETDEI